MNTTDQAFLLGIFALSLVLMLIGGCEMGQRVMQEEAVKQGVAEYIGDANGKPKFVWKKPCD